MVQKDVGIISHPWFLMVTQIHSGNYDCLNDDRDADSFSVKVMDFETGESLYEPEPGDREGVFALEEVKRGTRYALCFQNNKDEQPQNFMTVGFAVRVKSPPRTLPDNETGPDSQRALELVKKATAIVQDWESLVDHFDFLRNREAAHKQLSDEILTRIQVWTLIEAVLVVSMATGQVLYWKKFFETRRYL